MINKCYIINNIVIFYPAERSICSLLNKNRIKLNAPTSQLLEVFIRKAGVIIAQEELYFVAWGDNGSKVTPNTLYQNISLLRKALQDSGIKGENLTYSDVHPTISLTSCNMDINSHKNKKCKTEVFYNHKNLT